MIFTKSTSFTGMNPNRYLIAVLLLLALLPAFGQEEERSQYTKPSPYDLFTKYYEEDFTPFKKGNGYIGLALSLQDQSLVNTQRLFDKVVDGNTFKYDIEFSGGYFISDYTQIGLGFSYSEDKFEGTTIRDGDTVRVEDVTKLFTALPFVKPYIPVTSNQRLSFFMQFGFGLGGGNGLLRETRNLDEIRKVSTEQFRFTLGLTPGITFFAVENFAFEVGINVLGYELRRIETITDEIETSVDTRHNVNLKLNLLSLNIGLAYYFL